MRGGKKQNCMQKVGALVYGLGAHAPPTHPWQHHCTLHIDVACMCGAVIDRLPLDWALGLVVKINLLKFLKLLAILCHLFTLLVHTGACTYRLPGFG